ncbi:MULTISPECIES: type II toxin-antitoxin system RelE/ParE family toxin [Chromohalobacter]|uniref:Addiction module killer protein n=2 Tax=Chromohalobacter TaxID=42054 RepID=A0A1Q8TC86_9GAMM|nr:MULTISPECIES: type II toxin-antitoxin system RelE/ParE family toxin [Chromohalobacter]MCK0754308.1 type II toxin-antitoxin system RelE/ParE family toxin [Chromohalobacter japonicus]MCK2047126.1 type II toxin-antitoxin system RelE/ParE family toxin [Chromohalobacter moromii]MCT8506703.1 type II toxin-antitoxin system RelE/ParE family toxin [Chromohalobacter moromii]OLO11300.1 addiction module killer protein [Chromohalobacter japonicus]
MIKKIRHKKLKALYNGGSGVGLNPNHIEDLEEILGALDEATLPEQMNLPGYDFHTLSGDKKGYYSVHVNGPWVVTFTFDGADADQVDYEQYHDKKTKR